MRPDFACADFTFPLLPHDRVLRLIALLDLQGMDIGLFEQRSHLWPSREFAEPEQAAARLRTQLDDLGLVAADVFLQLDPDFTPFALNQPDPSRRAFARDRYSQLLDYACALGSHHVTVLPGVQFDGEREDVSLGRAADELAWRVERAQAAGLTLGFEPHVGSIVPDPGLAQALVERVPGLTITLDYTHFVRLGLLDTDVDRLLPYASHFHVRGARPGRLQARFAESTIDYARIVRRLDELGYAGWVGIEYVWIDWEHCNECDNVAETILFRDALRGIIAGL